MQRRKKIKIRHWQLTLMVLPAILYFFVFSYLPMVGLAMAFQKYTYTKGIFSDFVGLDNFKFLFVSGDVVRITRNTILYNLAFIVVNLVLQLVCAIAISEFTSRRFEKVTQSMMFLPYFLSWVVVSAIAYNIFNYEYGLLNNILKSLKQEPINVYMKTAWWPVIIVLFNTWKSLGYGVIIYVAAIMGIDQELYEAAKIDGANVVQRITKITLPMLRSTIVTLLLLNISRAVRGDFNMFFNLVGNNSFLYSKTDIIETYVYRALIHTGDVGMGAAASFYQSVIGFVLIITVNGIIKKLQPDYALF